MRIVPLYLLAVFLIFLIVGFITHFTLHETFGALMTQLGQWIMIMEPNVNRLNGTKFIICGVQWSLAYEWMFYCSLALIGGAFFRLKPSLITLLLATAFLIVFALIIHSYYPNRLWWRLCPFLSGLAAAFVARNEKARKFFSHWWATIILLALGYIAIFVYPLIFSLVPMICMTVVFIGLTCGNDLFGLLSWKPCRQLGQISYSLYLLHGLVLFVAFYFILGFSQAASFSIVQHWLTICVCGIFVVILCSLSYCYIEKPGIDSAAAVTRKIRTLFGAKRSPVLPAAQ
jgi:peptidoglycan/LPS O-acetylase OafA/YrhL